MINRFLRLLINDKFITLQDQKINYGKPKNIKRIYYRKTS